VPVVATVSQAAGAGHALARDAVVVDTDTLGVGVQWSENSADDALEETLDMLAQCCGPGSRFAHLRDALQGGAHEHTEGHPHDAR